MHIKLASVKGPYLLFVCPFDLFVCVCVCATALLFVFFFCFVFVSFRSLSPSHVNVLIIIINYIGRIYCVVMALVVDVCVMLLPIFVVFFQTLL